MCDNSECLGIPWISIGIPVLHGSHCNWNVLESLRNSLEFRWGFYILRCLLRCINISNILEFLWRLLDIYWGSCISWFVYMMVIYEYLEYLGFLVGVFDLSKGILLIIYKIWLYLANLIILMEPLIYLRNGHYFLDILFIVMNSWIISIKLINLHYIKYLLSLINWYFT